MELTDNDKQRIAIEVVARFTGNSRGTPIAKKGFILGAEYATLYERQQEGERCPSLKQCYDESKELASLRSENEKLRVENEEAMKLQNYCDMLQTDHSQQIDDISKLKSERQELVEALKGQIEYLSDQDDRFLELTFLQSLLDKLNPQR